MKTYDQFDLPQGNWGDYRKLTITRAIEMDHDFQVVTIDGNTVQGKAGDYILVDSHGHPYPCNRHEFIAIYALASTPEERREWAGKYRAALERTMEEREQFKQ